MNGTEFIRRARCYARKTGKEFRLDASHGKGSHGRVYIGKCFTTVKHGEIAKGLLSAMLKQLGIDKREF